MSNNSNYIKCIENMQQTTKKYWQYVYELRHIPTGFLYVGSRSRKDVLKKFEDCYTDKYLGSSCRDEGPFSEKDTKTNPQDYAKTVLKVFYDEDQNKAWKYENGENGLIMTYWNLYGKDKVLNQQCILNDGSKVWSNTGNHYNLSEITKERQSEANKKRVEDGTHNFLGGKHLTKEQTSKKNTKSNNTRVEQGTHPFLHFTIEEKIINGQKSTKIAIANGNHVSCQNYKCEWCEKELKKGDSRNYFKWHGDNCKLNPNSSRYKK